MHPGNYGSSAAAGTSPPTLLQHLQRQQQQDRQQFQSHPPPSLPSHQQHPFVQPLSQFHQQQYRGQQPPLQDAKYFMQQPSGTPGLISTPPSSSNVSNTFQSANPSLYNHYHSSLPGSDNSSLNASGSTTPTLSELQTPLQSLMFNQSMGGMNVNMGSIDPRLAQYLQSLGIQSQQRSTPHVMQQFAQQQSPFASYPTTPQSALSPTNQQSTMSTAALPFMNAASMPGMKPLTQAVAIEHDPYVSEAYTTSKSFSRVKRACNNCKAAKTKCDSERPCRRCSRTGRASSCSDSVHKKRGRKRFSRDGDDDAGDGENDGNNDSSEEGDDDADDSFLSGGGRDSTASDSSPSHTEKKHKGVNSLTTDASKNGALKAWLNACASLFAKYLSRWMVVYQSQSQPEPTLNRALHWFAVISQADVLNKLLRTGKDDIKETASTVNLDVLIDRASVQTAMDAAEKELSAIDDAPAYTLPLYPVPYILSPATFNGGNSGSGDSEDNVSNDGHRLPACNNELCQLIGYHQSTLQSLFSHLPTYLRHVHHTHLESTIATFVDAICSGTNSMTIAAKYSDSRGSEIDCIESISVHSASGIPCALVISLHSIVGGSTSGHGDAIGEEDDGQLSETNENEHSHHHSHDDYHPEQSTPLLQSQPQSQSSEPRGVDASASASALLDDEEIKRASVIASTPPPPQLSPPVHPRG